jgi:hypothetical protein
MPCILEKFQELKKMDKFHLRRVLGKNCADYTTGKKAVL